MDDDWGRRMFHQTAMLTPSQCFQYPDVKSSGQHPDDKNWTILPSSRSKFSSGGRCHELSKPNLPHACGVERYRYPWHASVDVLVPFGTSPTDEMQVAMRAKDLRRTCATLECEHAQQQARARVSENNWAIQQHCKHAKHNAKKHLHGIPCLMHYQQIRWWKSYVYRRKI